MIRDTEIIGWTCFNQKQASNTQQQHKAAQQPFQKPSPFDLVSTGTEFWGTSLVG
ncbi:hypothetical protein GCM10023197_23380 [Gordonia humi]